MSCFDQDDADGMLDWVEAENAKDRFEAGDDIEYSGACYIVIRNHN